ncbi:hypothetical protein NUH86_17880 [Sphingobium sp. JS3065]|uniref:hypothetical protein n=1 Tax=Sphingobium sp. JS3065 TaxID=2970925 RepID=UPI002263DC3D|nr:hypothetical protein [Sphingobium sp. JS3065]UZW57454.1 hypothetical protein NUH86_17880 [Sphingobium sp. JS3065]
MADYPGRRFFTLPRSFNRRSAALIQHVRHGQRPPESRSRRIDRENTINILDKIIGQEHIGPSAWKQGEDVAMPSLTHPILKGNYRKREDGLVEVIAPDGTTGVFDHDGNWIEGKLRTADAALCYWIAKASGATRPSNLGGTSE